MANNNTGDDLHAKKLLLRKKHLLERNAMDKEKRAELSEIISNRIVALDRFKASENILLYSNYGSEADTGLLHKISEKLGKKIFYPKVQGEDMIFYKITSLTSMAEGYKGIMEPVGDTDVWKGETNSMIIVPGAVFHPKGYRIGYGKGFYDRFLGKYPKLFSVGICFSNQVDEALIPESFDIPLHLIVTEKERYEQNEFN